MTEMSDRLLALLSELEDVTDELTPADAARSMDDPALQQFWRQWPDVSAWAGALWRELNDDLGDSATPASEGVVDVGGSD
ncbi:MAG: hypothetical protein ACRDKZ_13230 [Actinomycetota bacterium]